MRCYAVAPLAATKSDTFTYRAARPLTRGAVVKIPLAGRKTLGVVIGPAKSWPGAAEAEFTGLVLGPVHLSIGAWVSKQYLAPLGMAMKLLVNDAIIKHERRMGTVPSPSRNRYPEPKVSMEARRLPYYLHVLQHTLSEHKQGLFVLPELLLGAEFKRRLTADLNVNDLVEYHSKLTSKQRADIWWRVAGGEPLVVIGGRSALFLPWQKLSSLIVDEEDDLSHKHERTPRYHARAVAAKLSQLHGSALIYGSASPSLEVLAQVSAGKIRPAGVPFRLQPPRIIDMQRQQRAGELSYELWQALAGRSNGTRVLIFAPQSALGRVGAEIAQEFPDARVEILDTAANPAKVIASFGSGKVDVLVGSSTLARGWQMQADIIGVTHLDRLLQLPDFRATEKAYALLRKLATHLTGPGMMYVQTDTPGHPVLARIAEEPLTFAATEMTERKLLGYPPATRLTRIVITADTPEAARAEAAKVTNRLSQAGLDFVPPSEASNAGGKRRWQILYQGDPGRLRPHLEQRWTVDVDPVSML